MQRHSSTSGRKTGYTADLQFRVCVADAKFLVARFRHDIERKAGFSPGQPRDDQGRWTDGGQGSGAGDFAPSLGPDGGDAGFGDLGVDNVVPGDVDLGDFDLDDFDFGDDMGETFRTVEADPSGEASWSTVVSDRRADGSLAQELVFNRHGSAIHSEYAASGDNLGWDERHTVVTADGNRIRFERSGDAQIISDANTGEVLGRSTWGESGPEPEATLQPAFVGPTGPATIEAGAALFVWLSGRNGPDSTAVMSFKADEYVPGETPQAKPEWVGTRTREETNEVCPRHEEVRSRTDDAADRVRREGNYWTAQQYGTAVHKDMEGQVRALKDPNFRAEVSISKTKNETYGTPGSIRIDVLENVGNGTVCVYDIKTGRSGLSAARSVELVGTVFSRYPGTNRILLIETRPRR